MNTQTNRRSRRLIAGAGAALLLSLAVGCSSPSSQVRGTSSDTEGSRDSSSEAVASLETEQGTDAAAPLADTAEGGKAADTVVNLPDRDIISTGSVALASRDVAQARFDIGKVVDRVAGTVTEENSDADSEGELQRLRLVLRVPSADFSAAMDDLKQLEGAWLEDSSTTSEDVTTQVIDTKVRIRAQAASLQRVEVLLARAESIADIVAIEAELTRRQAELDSLKSRAAFLADQTSMSTITVNLQRERGDRDTEPDTDEAGFLAGLKSGWAALAALTSVVLTGLGALLPFALVFVLLGSPLWWLLRRLIRRSGSSGQTPSAA